MADQNHFLQPQFFVTREDDTMVPLIPLDELPEYVVVEGVSRSLKPSMIAGMTCIGAFKARQHQYVVSINDQAQQMWPNPKSSPTPPYHSDDEGHHHVTSYESPLVAIPAQSDENSSSTVIQEYVELNDVIDSHASPLNGHLDPAPFELLDSPQHSTSLPKSCTPGGKEYCSFWLRRGECDYAQQGCLYRHEMPQDLASLNRLGLRDIPAWYRERHGLKSLLAVAGAGESPLPARHGHGPAAVQRDGRYPVRNGGSAKGSSKRNMKSKPSPARLRALAHKNQIRQTRKMSDAGVCTSNGHNGTADTTIVGVQSAQNDIVPHSRQHSLISLLDNSNEAPNSPVISEVYSDIEAEYMREDAARKIRENADYALLVQQNDEKLAMGKPRDLLTSSNGSEDDNADQSRDHRNSRPALKGATMRTPPRFSVNNAAAAVPPGRFAITKHVGHGDQRNSAAPQRQRQRYESRQVQNQRRGERYARYRRYQKVDTAGLGSQDTSTSTSTGTGNGNGSGNGNRYQQRYHQRTPRTKAVGAKNT